MDRSARGLETGQWSARLKATFTPDVSGAWQLGLESAGRSVLRLDGEVVLDNSDPQRGTGFYGAGSDPIDVRWSSRRGGRTR